METGDQSLAEQVNSLNLRSPEFTDVARVVAEKTANLREEAGRVPYDVFIAGMEMAGVYPALEVIPYDPEGNFYLRRRLEGENASQEEESAWGGKLHFAGSVIVPAQRFELNFYNLLNSEVFRVADESERRKLIAQLYRKSKVIGISMVPAPERKTSGLSLILSTEIEDPQFLRENFEKITQTNLPEVIDQQRPITQRLLNKGSLPIILDTRKSFK